MINFSNFSILPPSNEAGNEKKRAQRQTDEQRQQHVNAQRVRIPVAHTAYATQDVTVDALRGQDDDHQHRRCAPSGQVKIVTFRLDRFVAPFQAGSQKPSHIQHYPPNAAGNSSMVQAELRAPWRMT
ncbi:hypothetical protein T4D_4205 [Trichinella pseudospiralis]|uniref:Uncharacterized protein n=1 Tax=Trichinella pseudospiralis TaxID=6337 RepID=A0A0V1FER7_TRIPS|nr:hypothetical protein T4D_4205 [Trichinella pseudospiralis]